MEPEALSSHILLQSIGFFVALLFCALFSFLETSITALRIFKVKELAQIKKKYKPLLSTLEKNPHKVLVTILIANSLANVTSAALITDIMDQIFAYINFSGSLGFSIGIGIGTVAILIFGEVIPKNIAKTHGEKLFASTLWITNITYFILYPFVRILINFANMFIGFFGGKAETPASVTSERELQFLIDYTSEKGLMDPQKTAMLRSIFQLGDKAVKEIMIPAVDIVMLDASASLKDALETFEKYQFSRFPVYEETTDNIIGMVHQKDIFLALSRDEDKTMKDLVRPIGLVPESMKINQLFEEFIPNRRHIAMVVNEFGSITGLVTLEDVLEEIVGDISDEYEQVTEKIIPLEKGGWLVDASVDLNELSPKLQIEFDVENAISLGGFLTEKLQHVPKKGERILYKDYYFQVQKASPKRVLQVLIFKKQPDKSKK